MNTISVRKEAAALKESAARFTPGPYVGPRPFEGRDKVFFFGRDREARELANMVAACPLTVVYGPSGAGKSSLLNAKLSDELDNIEPDWDCVFFSAWQPGFELRLQATVADALGVSVSERRDGTLDSFAQVILNASRKRDIPALLALDQFEEYFLYHAAGVPSFEIMLAHLANRRNTSVHVLLSLRSDRLFLLDRLRYRIPHILQNLFLVDQLGAEGAADAVRKPIAEYNRQNRTAIAVEDAVVDAVVRGADEREIRQRLPAQGRGTAKPEHPTAGRVAAGPPMQRIVAPFLQLALEALWRADIDAQGGTELTLKTLRSLAKAKEDDRAETLVGLLAQRHFDEVLSSRSAVEQEICATLFDRMVTNTGGKVAIALPGDFSSVLDAKQLRVAGVLLDELAMPGPNCLVRQVATGESAGQTDKHFEIVHDALAVPLLDWRKRWRERRARDEAAKRELQKVRHEREKARRWRRAFVAIVTAVVSAAVVAWFAMNLVNRRDIMSRVTAFTSADPQPEFQQRLLLGRMSMAQASGLWRLVLQGKLAGARDELRKTLLRSPRYGGTYRAAGVDVDGTRLVGLGMDKQNLELRQLRDEIPRDEKPPLMLAPQELAGNKDKPVSRSKKLQQGPDIVLAGFLEGIDLPVLLDHGILYYADDPHGTHWHWIDIPAKLADELDASPDVAWTELTAGAVQITTMSQSATEMKVLRLRPIKKFDGTVSFPSTIDWTPVRWKGQRLQPALSPLMKEAPHDRFAYLQVPDNMPTMPGQPTGQELFVGDLGTQEAPRNLWNGPKELPDDRMQRLAENPEPPAPWSVAFTDDGSGLVVRQNTEVWEIPFKASSPDTPVLTSPKETRGTVPGVWFRRPLIAGVRAASDLGGGAKPRFAWLEANGLVILEKDNDRQLSCYRPWKNNASRFCEGDAFTWLSGDLTNAYRLNFSRDGEFLILQTMQWPDRLQNVRIWDLRSGRTDKIKGMDDKELREEACAIAGIDQSSSSLKQAELALVGGGAAQPCEQ